MNFLNIFNTKKKIPTPWDKYYKDNEMDLDIPDINMYDQILKSSKLYKDNIAYEYLGKKVK